MNNSHIHNKKGFTLLETLVAIFIFSITITALFSLTGDSINNANALKDDITAAYLADEAIDYIRNDRDTIAFQYTTNGTPKSGWDGFLFKYGYDTTTSIKSLCFDTTRGCEIDIRTLGLVQQCSVAGVCTGMSLFNANTTAGEMRYYGLAGGGTTIKTNFARKITFLSPSGKTDRLVVVVTMSWKSRGISRTKSFITTLYNWGV